MMLTVKVNTTEPDQNITRWAGLFYILATVAPIMTYPFIGFLMEDSSGELPLDFLGQIAANEFQVVIGGLIELVYALAVVGIIVTLYSLLKFQRPLLSLGFFSLRFLEAISVMLHSLCLFCLVTLSTDFVELDLTYLLGTGKLLLAAREWIFLIGSGVIWSLSALVINLLLYQNRLLPLWIAVWGLIGAALSLAAYGLQFFGIHLSEIFFLPIGIQEMVFAGWLIIKGLNFQVKK
jgi:hypothetical protein